MASLWRTVSSAVLIVYLYSVCSDHILIFMDCDDTVALAVSGPADLNARIKKQRR